jgi:acyl carrier protein
VLVSRRGAATAEQREAVAALERAGAGVTLAIADVADPAAVAGLMRSLGPLPPLRGVVHAAGVLEDGLLAQQDLERFRRVIAPKLLGAWNLHRETRGAPLDFFVLYSSVVALLGSPGQGNYAAANAFLDALAHHRRTLGLPALSVGFGPFSGVGLAAAQENRGARIGERGLGSLTPAQGEEALGRLLGHGATQAGVARLDARQWLEFYPTLASSSLFSALARESRASRGESDLRRSLQAAAPEQQAALVEQFVREQAGAVLRLEPARIDRGTALKTLGVDSLMGLELRNRLELGLGLKLSATVIWTYPSVALLSRYLLDSLGPGANGPADAAPARPEPVAAPPAPPAEAPEDVEFLQHQIKSLSSEELMAALAEELSLGDEAE